MKYLHIMPPSKRMMSSYLTMLRENFSCKDHKVIFESELGIEDAGLLLFGNAINFCDLGKGKLNKYRRLKTEFDSAERVVFHCFKPSFQWLFFLYFNRKYLDKAIWVMWGIDIYNQYTTKKGLKAKIQNYMADVCKRRMRYPVAIAETDIGAYERIIGTHPVMCAPYGLSPERFAQMDELILLKEKGTEENFRQECEKENYGEENFTTDIVDSEDVNENLFLPEEEIAAPRLIKVQVGHNGFPFNDHVGTLNMLSRFCKEEHERDFQIILPIAYGNQALSSRITYVKALQSYVKMKMPERTMYWTKLVDNNAYTKRLATMDIAIFNSTRQNGLGNILQLLYMGKKVYLNPQNPLYTLLKEKGLEIYNVQELKTIAYEEFIEPVKEAYPNPWISKVYNASENWKNWAVIFDYAEGKMEYSEAIEKNKELL